MEVTRHVKVRVCGYKLSFYLRPAAVIVFTYVLYVIVCENFIVLFDFNFIIA